MPSHSTLIRDEGSNASSFSFAVDGGSGTDRVLLVAVRHGDSTAGLTVGTPTYNGVAMTQVAVVQSRDTRRMSVWKLADPASGSNTLAATFTEAVAQYSVTAIVVDEAEDVDLTTDQAASDQTGTALSLTLTAGDAASLLYFFGMTTTGTDDPFTPGTITEIEDSTDGSSTNHSYTTGTLEADGTAQSLTTAASAGGTDEWAAIALEVTPVSAAAVELEGSVSASATVSGALTRTLDLAGDTAGSATVSGSLTRVVDLVGDAAATATLSGTLTTPAAELEGEAAAVATVAGTLLRTVDLAGAVSAAAIVSATFEVPAVDHTVGPVTTRLRSPRFATTTLRSPIRSF